MESLFHGWMRAGGGAEGRDALRQVHQVDQEGDQDDRWYESL